MRASESSERTGRKRWTRITTPLHANAVARVVIACQVSDESLSLARLEARVQAGVEPRLDG